MHCLFLPAAFIVRERTRRRIVRVTHSPVGNVCTNYLCALFTSRQYVASLEA